MRRFAPDPETTGDVTALRVFQQVRWTPQHRAGWQRDPLAKISTLALAIGAVMLFMSIVGVVLIVLYAVVT